MNSIEQDIRRYLGEKSLPKNVARRVQSKLEYLRKQYGLNFDNTVLGFEKNPSLYNQLDDLQGLSLFFRRHIEIWLEREGDDGLVFSQKENIWIPAARAQFRIALYNPYTEKVESWSRIDSVSKWRTLHYGDSRNKKKSKFDGNFSFIRPLERAAFNDGLGLLKNANLMRMYLGFEESIGKSSKGGTLNYICLECTRIPRRQNTKSKSPEKVYGYKVEVHGYPVSATDINRDFRRTSLNYSDVPILG